MSEIKTVNETPEYKRLSHRFRWAIDQILKADEEHKGEIAIANKQVESFSSFQPIQQFKQYSKYPDVWCDNGGSYIREKTTTPLLTVDELKKRLVEELVYEENKKIAENNKKVKMKALVFMKKLGIPETKTERVSARSYKTREVTCSWVTELDAFCPIYPQGSWDIIKSWHEGQIKKVEAYYKSIEEEKILKEREAKEEIERQEWVALIVKTIEKYQLKFSVPIPPVEEVIDEIIKKNKYLYLAHYLVKNRGDWNDGYSYAEIGLRFFTSQKSIETADIDSQISENIKQYFYDFNDGRCFRDCEWNYGRLFGIAKDQDPTLYEDYLKLTGNL